MFGILITISSDVLVPFIYGRRSIDLTPNDFNDAPNFTLDLSKDYLANIVTNYGTITLDLYEDRAPQNVNNFVYLSNEGYYSRTKFHRLISDFLLQGGDRNTLDEEDGNDGKGRPNYLIKDEINWDSLDLNQSIRNELSSKGYSSTPGIETLKFERFSVGMANAGANTNGSQFFIIIANFDDPRIQELDGRFTPIGKIISGGIVLTEISQIPTEEKNSQPTPTKDIVIERIEIYNR